MLWQEFLYVNITNIFNLPIAANICNQLLREVTRNDTWSMAHVVMNPEAESLLHVHKEMTEIYIATRGQAELELQDERRGSRVEKIRLGNVVVIPPNVPHRVLNTGFGGFQHFVLATPSFDPNDVYPIEAVPMVSHPNRPMKHLPPLVDCFDGARIIAYNFSKLSVSHAFGYVINDPKRVKPRHYHRTITEYVFVIEGEGGIELDSHHYDLKAGDWVEIPPGTLHALRNEHDQHMVVLCTCTPAFDEKDVFWNCEV